MGRLHRVAMQALIEEMVQGRLRPGDWLPREVDLAARFGVSRGVARETIRALEERGVVRVRHGRGAEVMPEQRWNVLDPDVLQTLLGAPSATSLLGEVLECRRLLEGEAAERAAKRASARDVELLSSSLNGMVEAAERPRRAAAADDDLVRAEVRFHRALSDIAGNRALGRMLEPMHVATATARHTMAKGHEQATLTQHRRILAAVSNREPGAARTAVEKDAAQLARLAKRSEREGALT
jgi:GntR family transcriptional repressor for pyruvate dehydrogenase complex